MRRYLTPLAVLALTGCANAEPQPTKTPPQPSPKAESQSGKPTVPQPDHGTADMWVDTKISTKFNQ